MTTLIEAPTSLDDGCDCSGLLALCGHCACDQCEECGQCAGGEGCACACMDAERSAWEQLAGGRPAELYLGTHERHWLHDEKYRDLLDGHTLFVSRVRLAERKSPFPRALHPYCIDSGGFSELQYHGRWRITAAEYVTEIRRFLSGLGPELCRWVAPQDLMCEEIVIRGGAGDRGQTFHGTRELRGLEPGDPEQDLTAAVRIHQRLTVDNLLELRRLASEIKFIPVMQGNRFEDYVVCEQMYLDAGIDLGAEPVVGLGSVCRRQVTDEIKQIVAYFAGRGYRLHGFGVKTLGLESYASSLVSADSMAWSDVARRDEIQMPGHTHKNCANCPDWAIRWHRRIVQQHLSPVA